MLTLPQISAWLICTLFAVGGSAAFASDVAAALGPSGRTSSGVIDSTAESTQNESAYANVPSASNTTPGEPLTATTSHSKSLPGESTSPRRLRLSKAAPDTGLSPHTSPKRDVDLLSGFADSSIVTAVAALAFVAGLFIVFAWMVKRGMPASSQVVPVEVVRILGRVPLGGRQFGNLLQMGGKLVLVHVTPTGVEKIAEIDNPQDVERIIALCSKQSSGSSQKEFDEVFGKFAAEQSAKGFLGDEATYSSGGRYA